MAAYGSALTSRCVSVPQRHQAHRRTHTPDDNVKCIRTPAHRIDQTASANVGSGFEEELEEHREWATHEIARISFQGAGRGII